MSGKKSRRISASAALRLLRELLVLTQRGTCFYCNIKMDIATRTKPESATIEHIARLADGGKWELSNIVACCYRCNMQKNRESMAADMVYTGPAEFYEEAVRIAVEAAQKAKHDDYRDLSIPASAG